MKFISKRDWWISALMLGCSIFLIGMMFINEIMIIYRAIFLLVGLLMLWIYYGTFYVLTESSLVLKCGPLKVEIPYGNIESIKATKSMLSSIALSTDKFKLKVRGKGLSIVYISPLDKEKFVKELSRKCVDLKILNDSKS